MAAKNSIKKYVADSYYHIYNRGVAKSEIFLDPQDISVFCSYLKTYLLPKDNKLISATIVSEKSSTKEKDKAIKELSLKNFSNKIDLLAYALMPNHFHLLVHQEDSNAIDSFMNSLGVRYVGYFNRKYHRVGPLFQGRYKAVLVVSEEQLLHLSRYLHKNTTTGFPNTLPEYLGKRKTEWVKKNLLFDYFRNSKNKVDSYQNFMNEIGSDEVISLFTIDQGND